MNVSFQGAHASFSEMMALKMYPEATMMPCSRFDEVFDTVRKRTADNGVIPLENSLTGRIGEPTELLIHSRLFICKEGTIPIEHCLIAQHGVDIASIKKVYGHPEALSQCRDYVRKLDVDPISWWDGAGAAKIVSENRDAAVIGNARISKVGKLAIIEKGVQDSAINYTRFASISTYIPDRTGNDKTTISFQLPHESGSLYNALHPLSDAGISLTRIESMPIRSTPWAYSFIADLLGHVDDSEVSGALKILSKRCERFSLLGSYPNEVGDYSVS